MNLPLFSRIGWVGLTMCAVGIVTRDANTATIGIWMAVANLIVGCCMFAHDVVRRR